ncbi:unnamed protein product [Urochloa decumbens]|uniref:F-box domain-containing protein n=1 Tax=Urochloa decumbens TaxID=240449 RepID=A0ABC8ZLK9_9POAL
MAGGRQRRRRRRRRKARQSAATATHISSLGEDLLLEIFLRLPSLATLVRAACTCPAWRNAVASSPAFRRRFRALHPAPLLGLFADITDNHIRMPLPIFAPADGSDIDPDVLAAIRGGDFGLTSLQQEPGNDAAPEPRRWSVVYCRDAGHLLLADWDAGPVLAVVNPLSRRRLINNIALPYEAMAAWRRGYLTFLRNVHWLSSSSNDDEDDPMAFRLVWLCHDESRVRAAVFSSDTWDWRVFPWAEDVEARAPPPFDEDDTEWLHPGTQGDGGIVCWRVRKQERVLALNAETMEFSVWELPPPCLQMEGWHSGSFGVVVGETEHGEPCIVRDTAAFGIDVLMRGVDGDGGAEKWLVDNGIHYWHVDALFDNSGRQEQDLLGVKDGFLYLATAERWSCRSG